MKLVSSMGGDVLFVKQTELGIRSNTQLAFWNLNNLDAAWVFSDWVLEQGLDR